jgi:hypothetical protein
VESLDWINEAKNCDQWRAVEKEVMDFRVA